MFVRLSVFEQFRQLWRGHDECITLLFKTKTQMILLNLPILAQFKQSLKETTEIKNKSNK